MLVYVRCLDCLRGHPTNGPSTQEEKTHIPTRFFCFDIVSAVVGLAICNYKVSKSHVGWEIFADMGTSLQANESVNIMTSCDDCCAHLRL